MKSTLFFQLLFAITSFILILLSCNNISSTRNIPEKSFFLDSQLDLNALNKEKVDQLVYLGMVWGFMKYYNPLSNQKQINWDEKLISVLPEVLSTKTSGEFYSLIENWIDVNNKVLRFSKQAESDTTVFEFKSDYGYIFSNQKVPKSLNHKLIFIKNHFSYNPNIYVSMASSGNADFTKDTCFNSVDFPNVKIRLLALFRYWNIIQYYYPYRKLIPSDWNKVLAEFIPSVMRAENKKEYTLIFLKLISLVNDTHANIWRNNKTIDSLKGLFITPFQCRFIEGKLIVTGYYYKFTQSKNNLLIGDIIEKIDGTSIDSLIKEFWSITPASNPERKLWSMPSSSGFLLRSNKKTTTITFRRENISKSITIQKVALDSCNVMIDKIDVNQMSGFKLVQKDIGYIYCAKLTQNSLDSIISLFANTKGLIIDLRCYPSVFMPFLYAQWLKKEKSDFANITYPNFNLPGSFVKGNKNENGGYSFNNMELSHSQKYNGKIVVLVNSATLSQAEYTALAFSSIPGAKVVGSTTAGADGDVSQINLPGGIETFISGIGVSYPDGSTTQQTGIKIDFKAEQTIDGIKHHRDDILQEGIKIINDKAMSK